MSDDTAKGPLALDSSVLVAMLDGSDGGAAMTSRLVGGEVTAFTSYVNLAEAEYVLCRRLGHDVAARSVDDLLASGYVMVQDEPAIHRAASAIKCGRAISLADCYTLAVAEATSSRPMFAFKERELLKEMEKKPFASQPVFLE